AMIATSAAFMLTGAPFEGPVAGLRVGLVNGECQAFIDPDKLDDGKLDLVVAGTENGVMMVEAGASEATEQEVADAIAWAFKAMQPAIKLQKELVSKVGVTKQEYELLLPDEEIQKKVAAWLDGKLGEKLRAPYPERNTLVQALRDEFHE